MAIYTVHVKGGRYDPSGLADRAVLTRDGFSWAALVFGPLWLIWRRAWLALLVWLVSQGVILAFGTWAMPGFRLTGVLEIILVIGLALEASQIWSNALTRRGYVIVDVISAPRLEQAERTYFTRSLLTVAERPTVAPVGTGRAQDTDMVGLFPSMGG
jgi:hypothetical protein